MAVKIGSARISETGTINGKVGDQKKGGEVSTQNWYPHPKGWYIARAKDPKKQELIAMDMEYLCANNHFGYGQSNRSTGYTACKAVGWDASKVKKDVNIDCSKAVQICCLFAGIEVGSFSTLTELKTLEETGEFEIITDDEICGNPDYWLRGDIGVTRTKGHTVVALTNGAKATAATVKKKFKVKTSTGASLRLRKEPVSGVTLAYIPNGETVEPTGQTKKVSGTVWYKVTYKGKKGWSSGKFLV